MGVSTEVTLNGTLTCATADELARVHANVDTHIALTRAEVGCLSFEVVQTDDPMVWSVAERFTDAAAFEAHQTRTSASDWARETRGMVRAYTTTGLE